MRLPRFAPFLLCALTLGCGQSSDNAQAEFSLLLTDAASDELAVFEVDVTGAVLHRAGGADVSALTSPVRVDFVELEQLSDLIVGGTLPAGFYRGLTLTLDFTNAIVCLHDQSSHATVVDSSGNPITGAIDVEVTFGSASRPQLIARRNHLWTLDLDLDQSLAIDSANNRVTFTPVLAATVDFTNAKPARIQGALGTVDTGGRTFLVQKLSTSNTVIAPYTVRTSTTTLFQIDGVVSIGDAGLGALASRANLGPRVFVQGTINSTDRVLEATAVETGYGVPGNGQDWIVGHVTARTGAAGGDATLTVLGQSLDVGTTTRRFNTSHTVNVVRGQTLVLKRGLESPFGTDDLNVGQIVMVFGDMTGTTMDAGSAANGVARMLPTSVFGIANGSVSNNTLTLDVTRFDLRDASVFDFTVAATSEADPDAYTIDTTGLVTTGITLNSRVRAIGFVNAVGVPADANFTAVSLVDRTAAARVLLCQWAPAQAVTPTTTSSSVSFDVSQALIKAVGDGFAPVVLQNSPEPAIEPAAARGLFAITQARATELHLTFSSFVTALNGKLTSGLKVVRISAVGTFDNTTQVTTAGIANFVVQ
ncbi:MAG: hypothetical protein R3F56_06245 [Planctomycetota bacterium]